MAETEWEFFMENVTLLWLGVALVILIFILANSIKVVQEYERGVVFRLGRLIGAKGPGLFFIIPVLDRIIKIDLRVVTLEIPTQEVITKDNVSVRVNAVLYFRVYDPAKAVVNVTDFIRATLQIAQTTLRSVLGQSELDELLSQRDKINETLQHIIDEQTEPWGIKVSTVEVKDVELPHTMQRAMARQAEAEREKRAKIIHAQGELQASESLAQAAHIMGSESQSIQLRYLQTLTEIAAEKNSTIVFPIPIDLISAFIPNLVKNIQAEAVQQQSKNGTTHSNGFEADSAPLVASRATKISLPEKPAPLEKTTIPALEATSEAAVESQAIEDVISGSESESESTEDKSRPVPAWLGISRPEGENEGETVAETEEKLEKPEAEGELKAQVPGHE